MKCSFCQCIVTQSEADNAQDVLNTAETLCVACAKSIKSNNIPIAVIVSRCKDPRIDRGACLDVKSGSSWFPMSYHDNAAQAMAAFNRLPFTTRQHDTERWRVLSHILDLGELASVAQEQPETWKETPQNAVQ